MHTVDTEIWRPVDDSDGYYSVSNLGRIGPTLASNKTGEAPSLLEHGGTAVRTEGKRRRRVTYEPRPYMGPAFQKEQKQLPAMWRDSVK